MSGLAWFGLEGSKSRTVGQSVTRVGIELLGQLKTENMKQKSAIRRQKTEHERQKTKIRNKKLENIKQKKINGI